MKKKDMVILSRLRRNARESLVKISKNTGIPVSTVCDKIAYYEKDLIKRHVSLLDFEKLGFSIRAMFLLKAGNNEGLRKFLISHPNVNSAFITNSVRDFWVDCIFRDMSELQDFNADLDGFGLKEKQTHFITQEIKREAFLTDQEYVNKL